jgi:hypothetical protein
MGFSDAFQLIFQKSSNIHSFCPKIWKKRAKQNKTFGALNVFKIQFVKAAATWDTHTPSDSYEIQHMKWMKFELPLKTTPPPLVQKRKLFFSGSTLQHPDTRIWGHPL